MGSRVSEWNDVSCRNKRKVIINYLELLASLSLVLKINYNSNPNDLYALEFSSAR